MISRLLNMLATGLSVLAFSAGMSMVASGVVAHGAPPCDKNRASTETQPCAANLGTCFSLVIESSCNRPQTNIYEFNYFPKPDCPENENTYCNSSLANCSRIAICEYVVDEMHPGGQCMPSANANANPWSQANKSETKDCQ